MNGDGDGQAANGNIERRLGEIQNTVTRVDGRVERMAAVMKAQNDRVVEDRRDLFKARDAHGKDIADIQRTYVREDKFSEHRRVFYRAMEDVHKQIGAIKISVTRIFAVAASVLVIVEVALRWISR